VTLGKRLRLALAPLDHRHRLVGGGIEVKVVEFHQRAQPVRVDVHERGPGSGRLVDARDDEGGARDLATDTQSRADALDQGRLTRTQSARQDHQVASGEYARQFTAERAHGLAVWNAILHALSLALSPPKRQTIS